MKNTIDISCPDANLFICPNAEKCKEMTADRRKICGYSKKLMPDCSHSIPHRHVAEICNSIIVGRICQPCRLLKPEDYKC